MKIFSTLCIFFLTYCAIISPHDEPIPLIKEIKLTKKKIEIIADDSFRRAYLYENFFVSYDYDINLFELDKSIVIVPFIMNVAPIIWLSGKTYIIDALDEDTYDSLERIRKVFVLFYPNTNWSGTLQVKKLIKNHPHKINTDSHKPSLAALFSGGLDAVATSMCHVDAKQLLITVWGSDVKINQEDLWKHVKKHCARFAANYGHEHASVQSNFLHFMRQKRLAKLTNDVPRWWSYTLQGLGYTSLAMPLAIANGIEHMLIASTRTQDYPFAYGTHPLIDNNICCAGVSVHHDGHNLDRLAKIKAIINICKNQQIPIPALRVCWGKDLKGGNCGMCEKCIRTLNEILLEGGSIEDFGFKISTQEACVNSQKFFQRDIHLTGGLLWHWNCIQNKAHNLLERQQDHPYTDHLKWICSLELEHFRKKSESLENPHTRYIFALLWQDISSHSQKKLTGV